MKPAAASQTRVRNAIVLSIVGHVCALSLLAILLGGSSFAGSTDDDGPALPVMTLVRREAPATPWHRVRVTRSAVANLAASRRRPVASATAQPLSHRAAPAAKPGPARIAMNRPKAATISASLHGAVRQFVTLAIVAPAAAATPRPSIAVPSPTPTPAPSPIPTVAPAQRMTAAPANFGGLFSQNYPPALTQPDDLAELRTRLGAHLHVQITVDETGRATAVEAIGANPDAALLDAVRSALLALRYVPADCNGLHCEGTLELTF